jgi:hypothetical protein
MESKQSSMTTDARSSMSILGSKSKAKTGIKLSKGISKNSSGYKSNKAQNRYGTMFRERDLILGFHNYSLMTPAKAKDINNYSGKNILQESTKQIAKSLVFDRQLEEERYTKVGTQENETQLLLKYYNNKNFIDSQKFETTLQTYKTNKNTDLPYLKSNTKKINVNEDPRYGLDLCKTESLNLSLGNSSKKRKKSILDKINSKLRSNLTSMNAGELYTPVGKDSVYRTNFELSAGKPSGALKTALAVSESEDPNMFKKNINLDYIPISSRKADTEQRSLIESVNKNSSICSLDPRKRYALDAIEKINKNLSKLHNHSKVNWSIKDVPLKLLTRPTSSIKGSALTSIYNNRKSPSKILGANGSFGNEKLKKPSNLLQNIRNIYSSK